MPGAPPLWVDPGHQAHKHSECYECPSVCLCSFHPVELCCQFFVAHYIMCLSVYSIITVPGRRIPGRPLLLLSWCPKHVWDSRTSDRPGSPILSLPLDVACWCLISCTSGVLSTTCVLHLCISSWEFVPLFCFILSCCGSKNYCYNDIGVMRHGVGWSPLSLRITQLYVPCSTLIQRLL